MGVTVVKPLIGCALHAFILKIIYNASILVPNNLHLSSLLVYSEKKPCKFLLNAFFCSTSDGAVNTDFAIIRKGASTWLHTQAIADAAPLVGHRTKYTLINVKYRTNLSGFSNHKRQPSSILRSPLTNLFKFLSSDFFTSEWLAKRDTNKRHEFGLRRRCSVVCRSLCVSLRLWWKTWRSREQLMDGGKAQTFFSSGILFFFWTSPRNHHVQISWIESVPHSHMNIDENEKHSKSFLAQKVSSTFVCCLKILQWKMRFFKLSRKKKFFPLSPLLGSKKYRFWYLLLTPFAMTPSDKLRQMMAFELVTLAGAAWINSSRDLI